MTGRRVRASGAVLIGAALLAGLGACGGSPDEPPASDVPSPEVAESPVAGGQGAGAGDVDEAVKGRVQPTLPPVAKGSPAQFGNGVDVTLVGAEAVEITGEGPGEQSGPGVAYTLRLHNRSGGAVALAATTVTAQFGGTSLGPALATGQPFAGSLAPGARADGSYAFLIPPDLRGDVTLFVTFSADVPVAAIRAAS